MNPKIEEINAKDVPTRNKIKPIPYAAPAVSPILLIHANEIKIKIPEESNVPIEAKCLLFAKNENSPINSDTTKTIIPTICPFSPASQIEGESIPAYLISGRNEEIITKAIAHNPIIVFFLIIFKVC